MISGRTTNRINPHSPTAATKLEIPERLRFTPLFSCLSDEEIQLFISSASSIEYEIGDSVDFGTTEAPAIIVLLSGNLRLADSQALNPTLQMLSESGSFFTNEILERAHLSCKPLMFASSNVSILRLDGSEFRSILRSATLNKKLDQEAQILRSFVLLRSTQRFHDIELNRFRPVLSQGSCKILRPGESIRLNDDPSNKASSEGLFIILSGEISASAGSSNSESRHSYVTESTGPSSSESTGSSSEVTGFSSSESADSLTGRLSPGDWFRQGPVQGQGRDINSSCCQSKDSSPDKQAETIPNYTSPKAKSINAKALDQAELLFLSDAAYSQIREFNPELITLLEERLHKQASKHQAAECNLDVDAPILAHISSEKSRPRQEQRSLSTQEEGLIPKLNRMFKKYPSVYQHSELECGITCLQMICIFYGKKVSLTQLRELCEIGRSGTSMLELAEAAEQLGFIARGIRTTYSGLAKLRLPVILYWKRNHFVVLYEIHPDYALIGDPAEGMVKIELAKFNREFSEHALEILPTAEWLEQKLKSTPLIHTLVPIIKPHLNLLRDTLICSLVFELLLLVAPVFTQIVIDQVIVHQDLDTLNILLIGMIIMAMFQAFMGYLRQFFLAFLSFKTDQGLFTHLFKQLLSLPLQYFNKHSTGDTLTRFGESAGVVQFLTGLGAMTFLDVLMAIVFLITIFIYNVKFGLAALFYAVLLTGSLALFTPMLRKLSQSAYDKQMAAESFLVEAIRGIERVKSAAAEQSTRWRWDSLFLEKLNIKFKEQIAISAATAAVRFVELAGQVLFLWLGAQMVVGKELTVGQMMAMTMLVSMIAQPLIRLVDLSQLFQSVSVAMERLAEILIEKPEESDPKSKMHLSNLSGEIRLEKVTFHYPGRESGNALNSVSFEAKPGQMIGIVGRSGSGKSTLTKVIQGLYLPAEGHVYVDGKDLSQIALSSYRRQIGVVSQSDYYFRGTIRENVAYCKPDATLQEIVAACTTAGINDFISALPSGYESVLNEGAENFSGGQRQCMAIARALLHKPAVLIFDEATSAMDSETENQIQNCMESLRKTSTMFVVAHRLSTIRNADLILVMDQGQIVESGTHESLTQEKGLYYYLCKKQSLAD